MSKHKYDNPLGRSGCRFVVGDVNTGDLQSFQFSRGGWGDAILFARQHATQTQFMPLIDIVCAGKRRLPLMQFRRNRTTGVVHSEPEVYAMQEGERPIAGLHRRKKH